MTPGDSLLAFTSCQAPIAEAFAARVAAYVGESLGIPVRFVDEIPWQERLLEFDAGRIHVCWMCSLPYVWRSEQPEPPAPLGAFVPLGERYADQPLYFSDVLVRRDSSWSSFAGLEGATWAYNEETSHSGYNAARHRLAQLGRRRGFFGKVIASGSHETSLRLLLAGEVDACAVDSTVLDLLERRDPGLLSCLRVIETLGPSPSPPWVVSRTVAGPLREAIRGALLGLSGDPQGRAVLASGLAARFAATTDADYDPIRLLARQAQSVAL